jgi:TP901-1 family phage major tail protein
MAVANGTALLVTIGGTAVSCQTDDTALNLTRDMIETTCKDATGSAKTYIPGEKDATIDVNAAYIVDDADGFTSVFSNFDNGTEITWVWGSTAAGEKSYTGSGYVSDLSASGPQNDRATFSFTIQVTGEVSEQTNPT